MLGNLACISSSKALRLVGDMIDGDKCPNLRRFS